MLLQSIYEYIGCTNILYYETEGVFRNVVCVLQPSSPGNEMHVLRYVEYFFSKKTIFLRLFYFSLNFVKCVFVNFNSTMIGKSCSYNIVNCNSNRESGNYDACIFVMFCLVFWHLVRQEAYFEFILTTDMRNH
jgi:hypothetical protein